MRKRKNSKKNVRDSCKRFVKKEFRKRNSTFRQKQFNKPIRLNEYFNIVHFYENTSTLFSLTNFSAFDIIL